MVPLSNLTFPSHPLMECSRIRPRQGSYGSLTVQSRGPLAAGLNPALGCCKPLEALAGRACVLVQFGTSRTRSHVAESHSVTSWPSSPQAGTPVLPRPEGVSGWLASDSYGVQNIFVLGSGEGASRGPGSGGLPGPLGLNQSLLRSLFLGFLFCLPLSPSPCLSISLLFSRGSFRPFKANHLSKAFLYLPA